MSFLFICPNCKIKLICEDEANNQICNCPNCGKQIIPLTKLNMEEKIKIYTNNEKLCIRWVYFILGLLFCNLGIHCFYAGYFKQGFAHVGVSIILCCLLGQLGVSLNFIIQFIWWIIDLFIQRTDANGRSMI